jgi:hypothetical protein
MHARTSLLDQAISYAARSVLDVTPALLPLIPETGRHPLFSPPVRPAAQASPGDRLVAFLGRKPPASSLPPDHPAPT